MTRDALRTLFHPFEIDAVAMPATDAAVLFLGAEPGFHPPTGFPAAITTVQGFRPSFLRLQREGRKVLPQAEGKGFDAALVLASRPRGESELRVADALDRVRPGGLIMIGGGKDEGIGPLKKSVASLVDVDGHLPKHHGVAFWLARPDDTAGAVASLREGNAGGLVEDRFHAAPGMFSHDRIDPGSRLLAQHLPADIKGAVADFCAGWGYLSSVVAERFPAIASLDLYEADFASLEAARRNLAEAAVPARFFWHDLAAEDVTAKYDVIVMNPPFHTSREADPQLGQGIIRAASKALRRGGRLFLVANRQLPYEKAIAEAFSEQGQLVEDGRFKVLFGRR